MDETPNRIKRVEFVLGAIWISKAMGASFCQVDKIKPVVRFRPWRTSGSQKWRGANPSLSASAIVAIVVEVGFVRCRIFHSPVSQAFVVVAKRRVAAAVA